MARSLTDDLRKLHELHLRLKELQEQVERGPRQLRARQTLVQNKQAEVDATRQKHKMLRMTADQKSLQLKSNEKKIEDLRVKLNEAASNREFDILRAQIEADKMANSVLEDEILEALEQVDGAQIAIKKAEEELATAKAEEARFSAQLTKDQSTLQADLETVRAALKEAETVLPEDVRPLYYRQVQAHGAGAMAEVNGAICSACYVALPPQWLVQLRAGQALFCKTCARLLYLGSE